MKKAFLIVAALAVISSCSVSRSGFSGVEKTFSIDKEYSVLDVSGSMAVTYSSAASEVLIKADSVIMPYLVVECKGGKLSLSFDWKDAVFFKNSPGDIEAIVPASQSLEKVILSGAASFDSGFPVGDGSFTVSATGASSFRSDIAVAGMVYIDASGASAVNSVIAAEACKVSASGASGIRCYGDGKVRISAFGASSVKR